MQSTRPLLSLLLLGFRVHEESLSVGYRCLL